MRKALQVLFRVKINKLKNKQVNYINNMNNLYKT